MVWIRKGFCIQGVNGLSFQTCNGSIQTESRVMEATPTERSIGSEWNMESGSQEKIVAEACSWFVFFHSICWYVVCAGLSPTDEPPRLRTWTLHGGVLYVQKRGLSPLPPQVLQLNKFTGPTLQDPIYTKKPHSHDRTVPRFWNIPSQSIAI